MGNIGCLSPPHVDEPKPYVLMKIRNPPLYTVDYLFVAAGFAREININFANFQHIIKLIQQFTIPFSWIKCASTPFRQTSKRWIEQQPLYYYSKSRNNKEFILFHFWFDEDHSSSAMNTGYTVRHIYIYDIKLDKFIKIGDWSLYSIINTKYTNFVIDENNELLHIFGGNRDKITYAVIHLKHNNETDITNIVNNLQIKSEYKRGKKQKYGLDKIFEDIHLCYTGNYFSDYKLHFVANNWDHYDNTMYHYAYNEKTAQFDFCSTVQHQHLLSTKMIYVEKKEIIMLLGGRIGNKISNYHNDTDKIWYCNIQKLKRKGTEFEWKEYPIKLPHNTHRILCGIVFETILIAYFDSEWTYNGKRISYYTLMYLDLNENKEWNKCAGYKNYECDTMVTTKNNYIHLFGKDGTHVKIHASYLINQQYEPKTFETIVNIIHEKSEINEIKKDTNEQPNILNIINERRKPLELIVFGYIRNECYDIVNILPHALIFICISYFSLSLYWKDIDIPAWDTSIKWDIQGVIYWIGTNYYEKEQWENPYDTELVDIVMYKRRVIKEQERYAKYHRFPQGDIKDLIGRRRVKMCIVPDNNNICWFCVDFKDLRICVRHYSLRHGKDYMVNLLRDWDFEASHNGQNWISLRKHRNDKTFCTQSFKLGRWKIENCDEFYRYFRINLKGKTESVGSYGYSRSSYWLCCIGLEIYGDVH
eukprot:344463_1